MVPSKYQSAVYDWITHGKGNAVIEAVAGSGKTTTLLNSLTLMGGTNPLFCAFNRHIADELKRRAPAFAKVSTIHSLGLSAVKRVAPSAKVEGDKIRRIVRDVLGSDWETRAVRTATEQLASITRLTLTDETDPVALRELMETYDIDAELNGDGADGNKVIESVAEVIRRDRDNLSVIDFDDMVYLPSALNLRPALYDWVCVDESQDLNPAQRELTLKAVAPGGRMMYVGDSRQAIYGFAGADTRSMSRIREATSATSMPLSICYRCPASHVRLAHEIVPQIEARPNAPEGTISSMNLPEMLRGLRDGDLVVCRVNAPLAEIALALIASGRKATLRGRDLSTGLLALVRKVKRFLPGDRMDTFLAALASYCEKETAKLIAAGKDKRAESLRDRIETVIALSDNVNTITGLEQRIVTIFSDDATGIVCSSVHRAKGLEANRVAVYRPELMPHPRARQGWEMEQEMNLRYVALTRAKQELWMVSER